jgi:hypothetical protein
MERLYNSLKFQVVARKLTSILVCSDCLDKDQPQWFPARIAFSDPAPVPNARPEQNEDLVYSGFGWNPVGGLGASMIAGVSYDFDLADTSQSTVDTDVLVQEDGELLTQEDGSVILT